MDAYNFISIHDKIAIQIKEHYIMTNNLTTLYWAVIHRVSTKLTSYVKQQGGLP
jgi:GH18 family chitinase